MCTIYDFYNVKNKYSFNDFYVEKKKTHFNTSDIDKSEFYEVAT